MHDYTVPLMLACVAASAIFAGFLGWRMGNEKRDVRMMLGCGAALGVASAGLYIV